MEDLISVFRFEGNDGYGPYRRDLLGKDQRLYNLLNRHNGSPDHPTVHDELRHQENPIRDDERHQWFSVASSLEQLPNWFDFAYDQLIHSHIFHLQEYRVPRSHIIYLYSGKQLIFKKPNEKNSYSTAGNAGR